MKGPEPEEESFYLEYKPKYKIFHELMTKRMRNVLLVSSIYDSFMLEEDGRLSDQIYEEFQNLNLRTLPRITRVSSAKRALELLLERDFDLVITMRRVGDIDAFSFGKRVKETYDIPVILLLNSVVELNYLPLKEKQEGIDRVFVWNGDSKIFVAIIKHLEDKINADYDTKNGQVRVFIFVDDSPRFFSLLLPELYSEIMRQTHRLISEGTNDFQDLLKMRVRPKILLAENYEEAMEYYEKYKSYVMGVISDIEFPQNGKLSKNAGFKYVEKIKKQSPNMPIILQSSKNHYRERAEKAGCYFIHKKSHGMIWDLRKWLLECVGFGEFKFKLPNGKIVGKANDVIDFYNEISKIPIESLVYHGENDHFSNWLSARGEFEIANILKPRKVSEFHIDELREFLLKTIEKIVIEKTHGIINDFSRSNYHPEILFLRLRPGSLGGKGRGIAFLMFLLNSFLLDDEFPDVSIQIPKTIVIGTDEFDKFMEDNNLYEISLSNASDEEIKERFVKASLSESIKSDLEFLLQNLEGPLAVRSSSLLEDSAYQPFAGIFDTYMIPNNSSSVKTRMAQLCQAIKLVYASPFLKQAKSYAETIGQTVEESKMAVVIQKVVGKLHNNRFYPHFSGSASSYNFYPFGNHMKPDDRIAHLALGLGKTIVNGEISVRFCPKYPKVNFYSTPDALLNQSQKNFYAINLDRDQFDITVDDPFTTKYDLGDAIEDGTLKEIADNYDFNSQVLSSGYYGENSPIITFNKQLKLETVPFAKIIERILSLGERTMGCSIEIEFAGNFKEKSNEITKFYILQIRPFLQQEILSQGILEPVAENQKLAFSTHVSGNISREDIRDIVYIIPEKFDKMQTLDIVKELDVINAKLTKENRPYLLIGFGRWGTSDRYLGIPTKWNNINGAKVIIESELENFQIDFSQGSHFFQNIVTSNIGYLFLKHKFKDHLFDWNWLLQQKSLIEKKYVRLIRLNKPLKVVINAQKREGIIIKPQ
ncbi:MAG: response regulator [Candidatus Heimdallarchaeota archaeon]|nr:response regulator [Candidatus Heimdallarchaeota archaeon]